MPLNLKWERSVTGAGSIRSHMVDQSRMPSVDGNQAQGSADKTETDCDLSRTNHSGQTCTSATRQITNQNQFVSHFINELPTEARFPFFP